MHVVRRAGIAAAATLVALLMVQAASAQSSATLVLTTPAASDLAIGNTTMVPVTVELSLSNVVCPQAGTATVNVQVTDPTPMTGISAPSSAIAVAFPLAGPQAYSQLAPYRNTMQANVSITVENTALGNHDHTFNVTATFVGTGIQGCQSTQSAQPFGASDTKTLAIRTAANPNTGGNQNTTTTTDGSEPSPALPLAFQVVLVALVALFVARRK